MSNRDRIAHAAEEAKAAEAEKAVKAEQKAAKKPARKPSKRTAKVVRMKIIWEVCNGAGKVLEAFAYPDKAAAEASTEALNRASTTTHILRATKVPME